MIALRPYAPQDFDRVMGLFEAVDVAAYGTPDLSRQLLQQWFTSSRLDYSRDTRLAFEDGRLVGYADVDTENDGETWWNSVAVDPQGDVAGVVGELLSWSEARAASGTAIVWGPTAFEALCRAYEGCGYRKTRASYRMRIDLDRAVADAPPVSGMDIRTMQPGEEHSVHDVHQETFADTWQFTYEPYGQWEHYLVRVPSFDPTLWFVARDGDDIAGICLCQELEGRAFVRILGVRRNWRRRGLGMSLLKHAFAEFARRGYDSVQLGVDAESLTGANRLYEAAGMRVVRQTDHFEKALG